MTATHTPGPWKHCPPTGAIKTLDYKLIASVFCDDPKCEEDARTIANCNLIAAAPDLLSALQAIFSMGDAHDADSWNWDSAEAMRQARAAIAKAKGE